MTGSMLNIVLASQEPVAAFTVETAFKGGGGLWKLVKADPSIEQVAIEGVNEPCFRLAATPA